ncbi:MAG: hypothetical protein WA667_23455 [Candidatus Nitrosopolaris sp.]
MIQRINNNKADHSVWWVGSGAPGIEILKRLQIKFSKDTILM